MKDISFSFLYYKTFLLTIKLSLILISFRQLLSTMSTKVQFIVIQYLKETGSKHLAEENVLFSEMIRKVKSGFKML